MKLVFLPGFPGEAYPRTITEVRVSDLVKEIAESKSIGFTQISYPGINDHRIFNFHETYNASLGYLNELNSEDVILVGQSWGGLLALILAPQFKLKKTILITPYLIEPSCEEIDNLIQHYSLELPSLIDFRLLHNYKLDIKAIFNRLNQQNFSELSNLSIAVSKNDEVIPCTKLEQVLKKITLGSNIFYCEADHNFSYNKNYLKKWLEQNV